MQKDNIAAIIEDSSLKSLKISPSQGHEKYWKINDNNGDLALIHYNSNVPKDMPLVRRMRGLIVDTCNGNVLGWGFGLTEEINSGTESFCVGEDGIRRINTERGMMELGDNASIRPGMPGIIIRVFKRDGIIYFSTFKRICAEDCYRPGGCGETYGDGFMRLCGIQAESLQDALEKLFPQGVDNPGYMHVFHMVTRDFLISSPIFQEGIFHINTQIYAEKFCPPENPIIGDIKEKPCINVDQANAFLRGTESNSEGTLINVGGGGGVPPLSMTLDNGKVLVFQGRGILACDSVVVEDQEMTETREGERFLTQKVYELHPVELVRRAEVVQGEGNLYASFVRLRYGVLNDAQMEDRVARYMGICRNTESLDVGELVPSAFKLLTNDLHREEVSCFPERFYRDKQRLGMFIANLDRNIEDLRAKVKDDEYIRKFIFSDRTLTGMAAVRRVSGRKMYDARMRGENIGRLRSISEVLDKETPRSLYKMLSSMEKYRRYLERCEES